jgi:FtsH-binding integral membrane protein
MNFAHSVMNSIVQSSIASTFYICASTFVACGISDMTTKRDLTSVGGFLTMGLIGIIIASVVNLFVMLLRILISKRS